MERRKLILTRGIQGSGIVIKQIGLLEFNLLGLLPTCDKCFGEIRVIKLKENE